MKKIILTFSTLIFSILLNAQTVYVDAAGIDTNPGTIALPWKTIQHAADMIPSPPLATPYTVIVRQGIYKEYVTITKSGNSNNWVTFKVNPGDIVTLDGEHNLGTVNIPDNFGLFSIAFVNYIEINGFRCINAGNPLDTSIVNIRGIAAEGSDHIIIKNNYTDSTVSSGIFIGSNSSNITIDSNEIVHACNDGEQECLSVSQTDTFTISNNIVHDNGGLGMRGGEGIDAKEGSKNGNIFGNEVYNIQRSASLGVGGSVGIYIEAWNQLTHNINVYNNKVHDILGDGFSLAAEAGGPLQNINVYNNISYNNSYSGITIANNDDGISATVGHNIDTILIINNTIYGCGSVYGGGIYSDNPDATNITISNNIVSNNTPFQIGLDVANTPFSVTYNLINGVLGSIEYDGTNVSTCNPLFVSSATGNFHVQVGSCAIDSGINTNAPLTDFDGVPRPQGSGIDIGAFELMSTGISDKIPSINKLLIFPTPTNNKLNIELNLPETKSVSARLYDMLGKEVKVLINNKQITTGQHLFKYNLSELPSGLYHLSVTTENERLSSKVIIAR